ncbi:hypothetical protein BGW38_002541 [Lunasporangiospora selenospora]|uniref:RING-type E3 ubiquitin transferase n=1 Tax=Lunasporangiospora selenospora TaxID=979761 RepID=A0A9P6G3Y4_9FUNG|nr:hypothetical protein BGW38_002541 [Lunasporangiospora selenospora]
MPEKIPWGILLRRAFNKLVRGVQLTLRMVASIFLLREWVTQNQDGDGALAAAPAGVIPAPRIDAEAPGFNVEHAVEDAVERLIAAQHHMEAMVEGEAESSDDSDSEVQSIQWDGTQREQSPTAAASSRGPWNLVDPQHRQERNGDELDAATQAPRTPYYWRTEDMGESSSAAATRQQLVGTPPSASEPRPGNPPLTGPSIVIRPPGRPINERTHSSDPTTVIHASTNVFDQSGRRPRTLDGLHNQGITFRAPEDLVDTDDNPTSRHTRAGYVYDPLNQTYHPDSRWVLSPSDIGSDPNFTNGQNSLWTGGETGLTYGESSSSGHDLFGKPISSITGEQLYWKEGIPLTYDNVYLNQDGSGMTTAEKMTRYQDLAESGKLSYADIRQLPVHWRRAQVAEQLRQLREEERGEGLERRARQQELIRQINERGIRRREAAAHPGQADQPIDNAPVPAQLAPPAQAQPAAPVARAPPVQPNDAIQADDFEDGVADDFDGILEVIGIIGSYWLLLQNSLLMSALICAGLGVGVWIPFMIGKTVLLMNPFNIIRTPLIMLSRLTDPILDYIFDRVVPATGVQLSRFAGPVIESQIGSVLLKPVLLTLQEQWTNILELIVGVSKSDLDQVTYSKNATEIIPVESNAANLTLIHQITQTWNGVVNGTSSGDRFMAISLGYIIVLSLTYWYYSRIHSSHDNGFNRIVKEILRKQGLVLKIVLFVAIEMIAFPLFCGALIGVATLPLFQGASISSRIVFFLTSPGWSLVLYWLVGTTFMFNISMFISYCRTIVRKGVLWFIRDPNDQTFHPVREILERPITILLRKQLNGAMTYLTLIVLGVFVPVYWIKATANNVLPLRWTVEENEQFYNEEGQTVYRTWGAWLRRTRPNFPTADQNTGDISNNSNVENEVVFIPEGKLVRVPNTDRVIHIKDRRVFVPVNVQGNALDPLEDIPGVVDPQMDPLSHGAGPFDLLDPKADTTVVYAPPHFKLRLVVFTILIWTSVMMFLAHSIVVPLWIGRFLISLRIEKQIHDIYSFLLGVYFVEGVRQGAVIIHRHLDDYRMNGLPSMDAVTRLENLKKATRIISKLLYFGITFVVIMPFTLGLLTELLLVLPLRTILNDGTGIIFVLTWAVGLLYMKIIHRIITGIPNNQLAAHFNRIFVGRNIDEWDIGLANSQIIFPFFRWTFMAIGVPAAIAWVMATATGATGAMRIKVFRLTYPATFLTGMVLSGLKEAISILQGWSQHVRDQEYLVGRRLHNLRDEDVNELQNQHGQHDQQGQQDQQDQQDQLEPVLEDRASTTTDTEDWRTSYSTDGSASMTGTSSSQSQVADQLDDNNNAQWSARQHRHQSVDHSEKEPEVDFPERYGIRRSWRREQDAEHDDRGELGVEEEEKGSIGERIRARRLRRLQALEQDAHRTAM